MARFAPAPPVLVAVAALIWLFACSDGGDAGAPKPAPTTVATKPVVQACTFGTLHDEPKDACERACAAGDAEACAVLANVLHAANNLARAREVASKSCELGSGMGCAAAAAVPRLSGPPGASVPVELDRRADALLEAACDRAVFYACAEMATRIRHNIGGRRDKVSEGPFVDAFVKHATRACAADDLYACYQLSGHYQIDAPDRAKAMHNLERACTLGHGKACAQLGNGASTGRANELYERACTLGYKKACGRSRR